MRVDVFEQGRHPANDIYGYKRGSNFRVKTERSMKYFPMSKPYMAGRLAGLNYIRLEKLLLK